MVKQRIIEEASGLFAHSGVKSTTMDDLAKHMGISKRTIYENFRDKETLLIACINSFYAENKEFTDKVFLKADNVVDAILVLLEKSAEQSAQVQFNMLNDIRKYYPLVYREHLICQHTSKNRNMAHMVRRGITEGVFRDDLNPEIIALFFSKQGEGITLNDKEFEKFHFTEVFENMVITFLRGICTPRGLEIVERYGLKKKEILPNQ